MKVIIVDDEVHVRFLLRNFISSFAMDMEVVAEAEDGELGVQLCEKLQPDLVISDIRMPNMRGLEMLARINALNMDIMCVFVSAYNDFEYARTALQHGAKAYLLKPIQEAELYNTLQQLRTVWLKQRREEKKLKRMKTELNKLKVVRIGSQTQEKLVHSAYSRAVQKALMYIDDHYHEDISLDVVSRHIFLNKNYFSDLFHKEVGKPFVQYLSEYRIEKAKILLDIGDFKTAEIAHMIGFQNDSYFIKVFKRFEDCTPSEYKQKRSKGEGN